MTGGLYMIISDILNIFCVFRSWGGKKWQNKSHVLKFGKILWAKSASGIMSFNENESFIGYLLLEFLLTTAILFQFCTENVWYILSMYWE